MLRAEHQSAWMSKITNDNLNRFGTGCFIAVPIWHQWRQKENELNHITVLLSPSECECHLIRKWQVP